MKPKPFTPDFVNHNHPYVKDKAGGEIWHCCGHRILYADTDRSQMVYHANHLKYFEIGRASLMRDAAYPYREIEESGYMYPIIQVGVEYFASLRYDDPISIFTRPAELERVKLRFDYVITHEKNHEIVCKGFTRHCAVNSSGTPVGIDPKTLCLWKNFPRRLKN